jgi:threonine aldolase
MASRDIVDLRSDTVTRPTPEMRRVMAEAEVGDDVFGDDPTVNALQEYVADLLGMEAALFVPSGTMGNEVAIAAQTRPGDEIIADRESHVYLYEGGGPAMLSGCSMKLLSGRWGMFTAGDVRSAIRPDDCHAPRTSLVVIENTHNRGGGTCWAVEPIAEIRAVAEEAGLKMHLDGARLMNACVATGRKPTEYTRYFDTVSICFSKGLGAPIGSAVAGRRDTVCRMHRMRKVFGGGMRQAGIIAAAARYALEHHVDRLAEDHAHARRLAEGAAELPHLTIDLDAVQTNIVYMDVDPSFGSAGRLEDALRDEGVWMLALGERRIRAVTHMEVTRERVDRALRVMGEVLGRRAPGRGSESA